MNKNIILIGMPSSGKTTIGKILSKRLNMNFLDTDLMYKYKYDETPKETVAKYGREKFLEMQEKLLLGISIEDAIISTGGGVIYNEKGLLHLKRKGFVFYLNTPYDRIRKRVDKKRSLARPKGQDLKSLYIQRTPLYEKYADEKIDCKELKPREIAKKIIDIIKMRGE